MIFGGCWEAKTKNQTKRYEEHPMSLSKVSLPIPANIETIKRFDTRFIDGNISNLNLFKPTPDRDETLRNYTNNPLTGDFNHIVSEISVDCTAQVIRQSANVDPVQVINSFKNATFRLETNGGREETILLPLKDFMNLSQTRIAVAGGSDGGTAPALLTHTELTIEATGPRKIPNLFYLGRGEGFTVDILFNDGKFPAAADVIDGKIGLQVELTLAKMTNGQLTSYKQRLEAAR